MEKKIRNVEVKECLSSVAGQIAIGVATGVITHKVIKLIDKDKKKWDLSYFFFFYLCVD